MRVDEQKEMTLEDYLRQDANLYPDKVAVICGDETCTYRQLWERVEARAAALNAKLIPFPTTQSIDFLVEYFAIHLAGAVAVPLEKSQYDSMKGDAEPLFSGLTSDEDQVIPQGVADILFTTGTTGKSKGVMISHSTIIANAENLIAAQGFHHDLTFIINGPLNHIGSLSKVYPIILVGGTLHILEGMKDLNAFFGAMEPNGPIGKLPDWNGKSRFASFLVPASIRMLLAFASERLASYADRIEFLETGAAPISQADMQRLCEVLPKSRLFNTYASTETGIISTYDFNQGECVAGCLGKPMRHSRFFIVDEERKKVANASTVGKVACSGKTLMAGYYGDEALTESILRDGIIYTNDLAEIDADGNLRLKGRDGDVINVGGYKVAPTEVENVALAISSVKDCICIPAQHRVLGTVLKLLVVLQDGFAFDKRQLALGLREKLEAHKVPMLYEQVTAIHRTFNGKLDRKAYLSSENDA